MLDLCYTNLIVLTINNLKFGTTEKRHRFEVPLYTTNGMYHGFTYNDHTSFITMISRSLTVNSDQPVNMNLPVNSA